jgi:hypothetical protein
MPAINVKISEELDRKFRETIAKKFGVKKGNLKMAVEEALRKWVSENRKKVGKNERS